MGREVGFESLTLESQIYAVYNWYFQNSYYKTLPASLIQISEKYKLFGAIHKNFYDSKNGKKFHPMDRAKDTLRFLNENGIKSLNQVDDSIVTLFTLVVLK